MTKPPNMGILKPMLKQTNRVVRIQVFSVTVKSLEDEKPWSLLMIYLRFVDKNQIVITFHCKTK